MLHNKTTVALVANSNGLGLDKEAEIKELLVILKDFGLNPLLSSFIYRRDGFQSGTPQERVSELHKFYLDSAVGAIFDVSGGDLANQILPYLDYDLIKANPKPFFGYSDVTTVLNSITAKTGNPTYLYQIRNLVNDSSGQQRLNFRQSLLGAKLQLFSPQWEFIQGEAIEGNLIGGNIRCFLKLAGTNYFPNVHNKVLFLESFGGDQAKIITYLNQLDQIGVFDSLKGILLGTFTELEQKADSKTVVKLLLELLGEREIAIAQTKEVGHGVSSKCLIIGQEVKISRC